MCAVSDAVESGDGEGVQEVSGGRKHCEISLPFVDQAVELRETGHDHIEGAVITIHTLSHTFVITSHDLQGLMTEMKRKLKYLLLVLKVLIKRERKRGKF